MDGGSLENVIHQLGTIPENVIGNIAYQILYALSYLKTRKRVHRDIKPPNILINSRGQVKLSDFGIATELCSSIGFTLFSDVLAVAHECCSNVRDLCRHIPIHVAREDTTGAIQLRIGCVEFGSCAHGSCNWSVPVSHPQNLHRGLTKLTKNALNAFGCR